MKAGAASSASKDDAPLLIIARDLTREVRRLKFGPPVTHVYNPLEYALAAHREYLERYGRGQREIVLLGMNPGPFGMAQTGVPFGEVAAVRDWLGIRTTIAAPAHQHPKRPILGMDCPRSEVSGARLWGWARELFGSPERFFARFFVLNYCPLVFMEHSGKNRTPDQLPAEEREPLLRACDRALARAVDYLRPRFVVGVGAFAEKRARQALAGHELIIGRVPHPSPASPLANRGWATAMTTELARLGITLPR
jgi:single-strand selective monofunctional uracil DNA glycosylase